MNDKSKDVKQKPISILFISDLHLGQRNTCQGEMTHALAETIFPLIPELDILFINGDFFDTLVLLDSQEFIPIYEVILGIFMLCEKHKVKLRIMQGTYLHDRKQCQIFKPFYHNGNFTFDFDYVPDIHCEEIIFKDRSLKIGYIPDDLPFKSSDDIVKVLTDRMNDLGWTYLDYVCLHGLFEFTFPKMISRDNRIIFRENQFPFVKKVVDAGHVHQHRISNNFISNGSFDRLCHGEEDTKGCVKILDYPTYYTANFIKNKHPAIFNTLVFSKDDTTDSIRVKLSDHISAINTIRKIHIRCIIDNIQHKQAIKDWFSLFHPDIKCDIKRSDECKDSPYVSIVSDFIKPIEKKIAPTNKTIFSFVRNHINSSYDLSIEKIKYYLENPS